MGKMRHRSVASDCIGLTGPNGASSSSSSDVSSDNMDMSLSLDKRRSRGLRGSANGLRSEDTMSDVNAQMRGLTHIDSPLRLPSHMSFRH